MLYIGIGIKEIAPIYLAEKCYVLKRNFKRFKMQESYVNILQGQLYDVIENGDFAKDYASISYFNDVRRVNMALRGLGFINNEIISIEDIKREISVVFPCLLKCVEDAKLDMQFLSVTVSFPTKKTIGMSFGDSKIAVKEMNSTWINEFERNNIVFLKRTSLSNVEQSNEMGISFENKIVDDDLDFNVVMNNIVELFEGEIDNV